MTTAQGIITIRRARGAVNLLVSPETIVAKQGLEDLNTSGEGTGKKAYKVTVQVTDSGPIVPYGKWTASDLPSEIENYIVAAALSWEKVVSTDKNVCTYILYLNKDASVNMTIPFTITYNGITYNRNIQFVTVADGTGNGDGSGMFIKLDLDNENDSIIYNDNTAVTSVQTTGTLYVNGSPQPIEDVVWSHSQVGIGLNNITRTNNVLTVSGMESQAGYVTLKAKFNNVTYAAVFSLKKVVNSSKYNIKPSVGAIIFNPAEDDNQTITIAIKKTDPEGNVTDVDLTGLKLTYRYDDNTETNLTSQSFTWNAKTDQNYKNITFTLYDSDNNYQDSENVSLIGINVQESLGANAAFKSFVFRRTNEDMSENIPTGGSYTNPTPDQEEWTDGIPDGDAKLWCSTRIFSSDEQPPQEPTWSVPRIMTDTSDFDVAYSSEIIKPRDPLTHGTHEDDTLWSNNADETTIWMATSICRNGDWEPWQISKIKGEKGNDGTSIKIKGTKNSVDELPIPPDDPSDCYIIGQNLYVWDGDSWVDAGPFKGDPGLPAYVHIKYANSTTEGDWTGRGNLATENPIPDDYKTIWGETPGAYIGIASDNNSDDPLYWGNYTWTKWKGEDGFGYEYIYRRTPNDVAPDIPTATTNSNNDKFEDDNFVPDNWTDNPEDVDEDNPYCWVCIRQKVSGVWQAFKGVKNTSKAAYWTKWSKDGKDGSSIKLDLDNEHDSIIYDELGNIKSSPVVSVARLYNSEEQIKSGVTFNVENDSDANSNTYSTKVTEDGGLQITVNSLKNTSRTIKVSATLDNKNYYYAVFTIKKLINQSKYELKCSKNAVISNTSNGTEGVSIDVEVYYTDSDGSYKKASELPDGYAIYYEESGNAFDEYSLQLAYKTQTDGKLCAKYSFDTDEKQPTSVRFILTNDTTNWTFLDSEEIPITYVQNGESGGTGPQGPEGPEGPEGPSGKTTVTIYKASYTKPDTPDYNNIDNDGWSTKFPESIIPIEISFGGLWIETGENTYRSHGDLIHHTSDKSANGGIEERFYFNNTSDSEILLPVLLKASCESADKGIILGLISGNIIEPNSVGSYWNNSNISPIALSVNSEQETSAFIKIPTGRSFITACYIKDSTDEDYTDCVYITFGNRPIWQCTYTIDAKTGIYVSNSMTSPTKTSNVDSKLIPIASKDIKENLLEGSRFISGRNSAWLSNIGHFEKGFGKNNIFSSDSKQGYNEVLRYNLYNVNTNPMLQPNTRYTLSFWGEGARNHVTISANYITNENVTEKVKVTTDIISSTSIIIDGVTQIAGQNDNIAKGLGHTFQFYEGVYSRHVISFSTLSFANKTFTTTDKDGNEVTATYYLENIDLVFTFPEEINEEGIIKYSRLKLLMPKLETGSYVTDFNVHDTDIGSKRNAPMRIRDWKEGLTWYSGEKESDLYTDVAVKNGLYYNCLRNHISNASNVPENNKLYWNPAEEFSFIATNLLLAQKAYIKNLVAELIQTALTGPRLVAEGSKIYFYGNKTFPALSLGVDDDGNGVLNYHNQDTGALLYRLGVDEIQSFDEDTVVVAETVTSLISYRLVSPTDNSDSADYDWAERLDEIFKTDGKYNTLYKYTAKRENGAYVAGSYCKDAKAAFNANNKIIAFYPSSTQKIVDTGDTPISNQPFSGFVVTANTAPTTHVAYIGTITTVNGVSYAIPDDYNPNEYSGIEVDWSINYTTDGYGSGAYNNPVMSMQVFRFLNGVIVSTKTVYKNKN